MLIYVAGPYSATTEYERRANVDRACAAGRGVIDRGHWPFIPHLTHFFDVWMNRHGWPSEHAEFYMQWDFVILRRCDALLYLVPSPGADRELALARELGLPVFLSLDEIPAVGTVAS